MRTYLLLLILSALSAVAQTETNMSCVERLEIPTYPVLAKQARIAGALTVTLSLGSDASIRTIASEWTPQPASLSKTAGIFVPVVEKSLRASTFAKSCGGKTVTLVFNFALDESLLPNEIRSSFSYPDQFWITAPSTLIQPERSKP